MSRFYAQTKYNAATLNQLWMSMIADSHDIHCDCKKPFAHLLDNIFPVRTYRQKQNLLTTF